MFITLLQNQSRADLTLVLEFSALSNAVKRRQLCIFLHSILALGHPI